MEALFSDSLASSATGSCIHGRGGHTGGSGETLFQPPEGRRDYSTLCRTLFPSTLFFSGRSNACHFRVCKEQYRPGIFLPIVITEIKSMVGMGDSAVA